MKIFGRLIFIFVVLSLTSCDKTILQRDNVLEVVGYGIMEFVADSVTLDIEINNNDQNIEEVKSKTKNTINALNNILLDLKINEDNIDRSIIESIRERDKNNNFMGYFLRQYLSITFNDNNPLGIFLEKIISYEDVSVTGYTFSHTNLNNYEIQARLNALKNAEEAAQEMAKKMNIRLGKIVFVTMHSYNNERPNYKSYPNYDFEWKKTIVRTVSVGYKIKRNYTLTYT
jgi:uncharacterized protein YggE